MLFTTPKIQRLNYQLVRVIIALKCKLKKGQEPSKTLCVTGISGTLDYTATFTSVKNYFLNMFMWQLCMPINSIERLNYKLINLTNVLYYTIRFIVNSII